MKLAKPILATLGQQSALILDIGMAGAFVEHYGEASPEQPLTLAFRWQGEEIAFLSTVNRSEIVRHPAEGQPAQSQTALSFIEPVGESDKLLQDMMATFVGHVLAAQKANANAAREGEGNGAILYQLGQARRSRSRGFLAYLWNGKNWTVRHTRLAEQPRMGFTVPAYEDEEDLETLCRAYEQADEEGRQLIRLVAELSVTGSSN